MRTVLCCLALMTPGSAPAQSPEALFPAAQCAAFWQGRDDYARTSAYLDRDPSDLTRAAAFRAAAVRINGNLADGIDTFIASQRPQMAFLFEAYIFGGDDQSRELHDRLAQLCEDFAADAPEFRVAP